MMDARKSPWRTGWESARANWLPMATLWIVAVAAVVAYCRFPAFAAALEPLARWQRESGWLAAFLNRIAFCGALPGVFLALVPAIRPRLVVATILAQTLWSGVCGVASDCMFSLNAQLFGTGTDFPTLCVKTAVCQFAWTPAFFSPLGSLVYFWIGRDFSLERVRREMPPRFYRDLVLPNLLANWVLWIPVTFAVHMFPTPLQVQLSGLAAALLSLIMLAIGRAR